MFNLKIQLKMILFFCIFALFSAYFIEYILNHLPCNLCLIERWFYFGAIVLISCFFIFVQYQRLILFFLIINFIVASIVSFYHVGIEQGFFNESIVCKINDFTQSLSKEELLKTLSKNTISCKEVTFKFLGLSLATINTFISLIFSVIVFLNYLNYEKNK